MHVLARFDRNQGLPARPGQFYIHFFMHERTLLQIEPSARSGRAFMRSAVKPGRVLIGPNSARVLRRLGRRSTATNSAQATQLEGA